MKNSHTSNYQTFNLTQILIIVVGVLMITVTSCSDSGTGPEDPDNTGGFTGGWSAANWTQSGITEGTTSINGSVDSLMLSYNMDLSNPGNGVSRRTAIFQVEAPSSGTVQFDWEYTGFHAFYYLFGVLTVLSGSESIALVNNRTTP